MDVRSLGGMLQTTIDVSARLDEFSQRETPLDKGFARFADDINSFTSAWGILEHTFRDPYHVLTGALIHKLNQIISDCNAIFNSLQARLQSLHVQYDKRRAQVGHGLFCLTGYSSTKKYRPLQVFFADDAILLARAQIVFATSVLNIIIAVIHANRHSRVGAFRRPPELRRQLDACLIEDQIQSRTVVARRERTRKSSEPSALQWMESLPTDLRAASGVFDSFARRWVRKSTITPPDTHGHNSMAGDALENHISQLIHQSLEAQEQRTQARIGRLEGRIHNLNADLTAQRETAAAIHAEDQEKIQSLETRILNQEAQRRADQQLIAELTDECERWKRLAGGGGDGPGSVHAVFNNVRGLRNVSEELDQSTQHLRQELEKWKRQVRQQREQIRTLQHSNTTLAEQQRQQQDSPNSGRIAEQQTAQSELQRLSEVAKGIASERDAWRREAERLQQRMPRPPPNAFPTGAMDRHYASNRKRDSDSGYSTNRESSGTLGGGGRNSRETLPDNDSDPSYESSQSRSQSRDSRHQRRQGVSQERTPDFSQTREQDHGQPESSRTRHRRRRTSNASANLYEMA